MENQEFLQGGYYTNPQFTPEKRNGDNKNNGDHFIIEDLLNFPNDDVFVSAGGEGSTTFDALTTTAGTSTDSSTFTVVGDSSCNSSFSGSEPHFSGGGGDIVCRNFSDTNFSGDLCVPYDELAELEWLSNFVEESFSSEDLQKLQLISGMKAQAQNDEEESETHQFQPETNRSAPMFSPEVVSVPGKARSKRSRAAPCNWTSRLLVVSPTTPPTPAMPWSAANTDSDIAASSSGKKTVKATPKKKEVAAADSTASNGGGDGRKCLHCATDKTPQWRTGPMGPKTLCNACGVRFKSGRLVPEYRPAASPTFVLTKHSNSHRKVLELRRQKELLRVQHQQQQQYLHHNMMFDASNGDDYLIHQHIGPDYRQLI